MNIAQNLSVAFSVESKHLCARVLTFLSYAHHARWIIQYIDDANANGPHHHSRGVV